MTSCVGRFLAVVVTVYSCINAHAVPGIELHEQYIQQSNDHGEPGYFQQQQLYHPNELSNQQVIMGNLQKLDHSFHSSQSLIERRNLAVPVVNIVPSVKAGKPTKNIITPAISTAASSKVKNIRRVVTSKTNQVKSAVKIPVVKAPVPTIVKVVPALAAKTKKTIPIVNVPKLNKVKSEVSLPAVKLIAPKVGKAVPVASVPTKIANVYRDVTSKTNQMKSVSVPAVKQYKPDVAKVFPALATKARQIIPIVKVPKAAAHTMNPVKSAAGANSFKATVSTKLRDISPASVTGKVKSLPVVNVIPSVKASVPVTQKAVPAAKTKSSALVSHSRVPKRLVRQANRISVPNVKGSAEGGSAEAMGGSGGAGAEVEVGSGDAAPQVSDSGGSSGGGTTGVSGTHPITQSPPPQLPTAMVPGSGISCAAQRNNTIICTSAVTFNFCIEGS